MTKFSDFIRNPGTAGPAIVQGIYALGFALRSEITTILGKFVRVDQAQSFTSPEKAQGRANIGAVIGTDVQAYDAALQSIAGLTTFADRMPYTTAPDTYDVTTLTAFARTILDDADAGAVRATIGLGNVDNTSDANKPISTATQTALNLKAPLASPAFTGVPTAPTAAAGDNDTSIATTAYVRAEFSNLLNVTGAAPVFAARAWVNFDGTGTVAIRASRNVSSVTENGAGDWTVNMTEAMVDTNYCPISSVYFANNAMGWTVSTSVASTSSFNIATPFYAGAGPKYDSSEVKAVVFR